MTSNAHNPHRRVVTGASGDDAAKQCATFLAETLKALVREAPDGLNGPTVAFSGGSTPARMFAHLAEQINRETDPAWWRSVEVLQVDERIAPDGDVARNANDLITNLLDPTGVDPSHRHLMAVNAPQAATRYAGTVARLAPGGIDIVVLGLGDDGHTASLVPGDRVVEERGVLVAKTGVYKGHRRVTLTRPCLDGAHLAVWLATGPSKVEMLGRLLQGDQTIPAGLIRTIKQVVFTDVATLGGAVNPHG